MSQGSFVGGLLLPYMPHPLLAPDANPGYRRVADAYDRARQTIEASGAEILVLFSTRWVSILGHQVQADPEPVWTHVDPEFHELGSIPYRLRMDAAFGETWVQAATKRGLHAKTVAYHGFPIDTGSVVALSLLNPDNRLPASICSCNVYSDRAETIVLGKSAADAVRASGKKAIAVGISALSNRMHTRHIDMADDRFSSLKDDEWNRKLLEFFAEGRLEDVGQLARTVTKQANADSKMKAVWWMGAAMGQHNNYRGDVLAYEPIQGTGAAVVWLEPAQRPAANLEFDDNGVEVYAGDRNVLSSTDGATSSAPKPTAELPESPA